MHAGWRLYMRFLRVCWEQLGEQAAVIEDPTVKAFKKSLYFLWRVTRAVAEYLVRLSRTSLAVDLDLPDEDFAFLTLDFKQS
eukprot:1058150-Pleurochrysis_carterae.AAC.1